MFLAACFLLFALFNRDRGKQIARGEEQEAKISQVQLEEDVYLIHIFIFNP